MKHWIIFNPLVIVMTRDAADEPQVPGKFEISASAAAAWGALGQLERQERFNLLTALVMDWHAHRERA